MMKTASRPPHQPSQQPQPEVALERAQHLALARRVVATPRGAGRRGGKPAVLAGAPPRPRR